MGKVMFFWTYIYYLDNSIIFNKSHIFSKLIKLLYATQFSEILLALKIL